jgi:crotonobetainyl-CoA:carnitine CoA-transferase CaiB-like acyl-CoA transferase
MKRLDELHVVELAVGVSDLGLGLAGAIPGRILADLGARVTRIVGDTPDIDRGLTWSTPWHRGKAITTDRGAVEGADVVIVYGDQDVEVDAPVVVRCRGEWGLLVEAGAGFCTQLAGHRDGPIFVDVRATGSGTAFVITASILALLLQGGGRAETSLYDGMLATLGCMIGRSERAAPEIEGYWEQGSTFPNFLYRCADGELIQVWFGGKGMYPALLEVLGDEPSEEGYYADQMAGRLGERARRWVERFQREPRDVWTERLRAAGVACEPVYAPGEVLAEPHCAEVGLAVEHDGLTVAGSPIAISPNPRRIQHRSVSNPSRVRLDGLKVVDFSAFVAGPLGAQVLADLGADVIKVEPPQGEAMRAAAYAVAACQRGKRSLAMDIGAPEARPVVEALLGWADVVLHNFRVGVAERLGIGADDVAEGNPAAVYCHASGFGPTGPRAKAPGNDALMQALTGFERAVGGEGNEPIAGTWIPIDMSGGWIAAIGMLAGLHQRATSGDGQRVDTSLLGAGMLLQSGAYLDGGEVVPGPRLDGEQTGYGPGYRIYESADGWFALVVPDEAAWARLRELVPGLSEAYRPLDGDAAPLVAAFAEGTGWVERLRNAGQLVEPIVPMSRDDFRSGLLAERGTSYETADWGHFEQIGPLVHVGDGPRLMLPGVGEHTTEVLTELGFGTDDVQRLLDAKVVRQG